MSIGTSLTIKVPFRSENYKPGVDKTWNFTSSEGTCFDISIECKSSQTFKVVIKVVELTFK